MLNEQINRALCSPGTLHTTFYASIPVPASVSQIPAYLPASCHCIRTGCSWLRPETPDSQIIRRQPRQEPYRLGQGCGGAGIAQGAGRAAQDEGWPCPLARGGTMHILPTDRCQQTSQGHC